MVVVASDHAGFPLKEEIKDFLKVEMKNRRNHKKNKRPEHSHKTPQNKTSIY